MDTKKIRPNRYGLIVKIDKKKQSLKKEKIGNIFIPQAYTFMLYYLQYGEIINVGSHISKHYNIKPGDVALFHHTVEHNPMSLAYTDDSGDEYRAVNATPHELDKTMSSQLYGIISKETSEIIPFDTFLFINNEIEPVKKERGINGIILPDVIDDTYYVSLQDGYVGRRKGLEMTMINSDDMALREDIDREISNITRQGS